MAQKQALERALSPYEGLVIDKRLIARMVDVLYDSSRLPESGETSVECRRCRDLQNELNKAYKRCSEAVSAERDALIKLKLSQEKSAILPKPEPSVAQTATSTNLDSLEPVDLGVLVWLHDKLQKASGTRTTWDSWVQAPIPMGLLADEIYLATEIPTTVLHRAAPHLATDSANRITTASWRRLGKILSTFSESLSAEERAGLFSLAQSAVNTRSY